MQHSSSKRIALVLFFVCLAIGVVSSPLWAADHDGYIIRSNVNEVRLVFAASDRAGHVVQSLRSTDVAVADNGRIIRHFRSFRAASEIPLDVVVLLDASDSVAAQLPTEIAEIKSFVQNSKWGERDRVSILVFGGLHAKLICANNCTAQIAQAKLSALQAAGATPLYDALFEAAEILRRDRNPESRPAIILFSDGVDTISIHSAAEVAAAAQNQQSVIYSVNSRSAKAGEGRGDAVLEYLASNTGGLSFAPGQNVEQVLREVLEDLHGGYVLTYELPEQNRGQHSVRILPTRDPRLEFRARRAYNDSAEE
jgi:VWFA-related protein